MKSSKLRNLALSILFATTGCESSEGDARASLGEGTFAIATTVFSDESQTSLLTVTEDPGEPGELDTDRAIEFGGTTALFGQQGKRVFALGSSDSPTIARHTLTEDNELEQDGDAVSLQSYGLTSGFKRPDLVPFVSASKSVLAR